MSRDDNSPCFKIEALVAFVLAGVPKEDATCGAWRQFVSGGGEEIGVAKTPEDTKVIICGVLAI
jgi:hypothetical protein